MSYIVHTICPVSPVLLVIKLFVVHYLVLKEAMEKGYVYVMLVKVIVEGPAGVGKTSLLWARLHQKKETALAVPSEPFE